LDELTLHTVFYDWLDAFIERREEMEETAGRIFGNSRRIALRVALASMRAHAKMKSERKAKVAKAVQWLYRSVLTKTLRAWQVDARETARQKKKVEEKRKQLMYRFTNRCVTMTFSKWAVGARRRVHVATLVAAARETLAYALKKGAFTKLRENVLEHAQERVREVAGAIAWSVAIPGKISMWPTLLRGANSQSAAAAPAKSLTKDAADSLAAFGKDNFNNALLQGLTMGASIAMGGFNSPSRQRRRSQDLPPLARSRCDYVHVTKGMELRPDSGDDDDAEDDYTSVTGDKLPLPIGANILMPQPKQPPTRSMHSKHSLTMPSLAPIRISVAGPHLGGPGTKQRKVCFMLFRYCQVIHCLRVTC
jgi:hypothetical protein